MHRQANRHRDGIARFRCIPPIDMSDFQPRRSRLKEINYRLQKLSQSSSTLPPLRTSTPISYIPSSSSSAGPHHENGRSYAQDYLPARSQQRPSGENAAASHAYHVFVTSEQGLVHQRSSDRDDFRQVLKDEAISMSTGKHACPECGRRFEKLSHYKVHILFSKN